MNRYLKVILAATGLVIGGYLGEYVNKAYPKNYEQIVCDDEIDPAQCIRVRQWYQRVQTPKSVEYMQSCCGEADAYWVQIEEVTNDGVWVKVEDDRKIENRVDRNGKRIFVINSKIDDRHQGNPTGHNILFIGGDVYCFFPGAGI